METISENIGQWPERSPRQAGIVQAVRGSRREYVRLIAESIYQGKFLQDVGEEDIEQAQRYLQGLSIE